MQLAEALPEFGAVGGETGESGDVKAANTTGYSNIEAIEMTASGDRVACYCIRVVQMHIHFHLPYAHRYEMQNCLLIMLYTCSSSLPRPTCNTYLRICSSSQSFLCVMWLFQYGLFCPSQYHHSSLQNCHGRAVGCNLTSYTYETVRAF